MMDWVVLVVRGVLDFDNLACIYRLTGLPIRLRDNTVSTRSEHEKTVEKWPETLRSASISSSNVKCCHHHANRFRTKHLKECPIRTFM